MKVENYKKVNESESGRMIEIITDWLDTRFTIPGTNIKFGLDVLVDFIPGVGKIMTSFVSLGILGFIMVRGIPFMTALKMSGNIIIDFIISSIPFVGFIFDASYKSNVRNLNLLEEHLHARESGKYYFGVWILFAVVLLLLIFLSYALLIMLAWALNYLYGIQ